MWRRGLRLGRRECILEALVDFALRNLGHRGARPGRPDALLPHRPERPSRRHPAHHDRAVGPGAETTLATIERYGAELARGLDLVGLVALEMFVTRTAACWPTRWRPGPHNSGHWTIDACATSQFEQLVRAICGLPLGPVDVLMPSRMENLIGNEADDWLRYRRRSDGAAAPLRQGRRRGPAARWATSPS